MEPEPHQEHQQHASGGAFRDALNVVLPGAIAGASGQILGHPVDTIKTRMQMTDRYKSIWDCASKTIAREGFGALYRGTTWPMFGAVLEAGLIFSLFEGAKRVIASSGVLDGFGLSEATLDATAGAISTSLLTPVYVVKVQLRQPPSPRHVRFPGPSACAAFNIRTHGLIRGMYAGALPALACNTISYAARFATYGWCVAQTQDAAVRLGGATWEGTRAEVVGQIVGGGLAGMATWFAAYPLDTAITKLQTERAATCPSHQRRSILTHASSIYRRHGAAGFYKGLPACMLRAFPVNAVVFLTYEHASKVIRGKGKGGQGAGNTDAKH